MTSQQIQKISDKVWVVYEKIQEMSNITKNATLTVKKTLKVKPDAVKQTLNDFKNICEDGILKHAIDSICHDLEYMPFDGNTQLFSAHNIRGATSNKLEFVCVAIRKYEYKKEYVCDYCISTFSYKKFIDYGGVVGGIGIGGSGVLMGVIAFGSIATGGTGPIILGAISAVLGISATIGGTAILASAVDTSIEAGFNEILEASFIYELTQRGYGMIKK